MDEENNLFSYALDVWFSMTRYPPALLRPDVVRGRFRRHRAGRLQELLFNELLRQGFRRTYWQLVLPGQIGGLIKKVDPTPEGATQYHVHFYDDGAVDCELESHTFSLSHFSGYRVHDARLLLPFIERTSISPALQDEIKNLFSTRTQEYAQTCIRASRRSLR